MKQVLPTIVISQFLCTSLWFAGNAVLSDMVPIRQDTATLLSHLTSAVQFGFISGTLLFALLGIADRFSPVGVFFVSAVLAAVANAITLLPDLSISGLFAARLLTGVFLAGIYPVGMKIASDHYEGGLGRSLGFLVGALVLGTAFPHLLRSLGTHWPWRYVLLISSLLSLVGGVAMLVLVPNGPFRKTAQQLRLSAALQGFRIPQFRAVALGYFGHMWELYTFWAFLPLLLRNYNAQHAATLSVSLLSFLIIGVGSLACATTGLMSQRFGSFPIARMALICSGLCCLVSPLFIAHSHTVAFLCFLFFWGIMVIADSPLFSTMVAKHAPQQSRGSTLTIVNCIGFSITILSMQSLNWLSNVLSFQYLFLVLAIGPALGLAAMAKRSYS